MEGTGPTTALETKGQEDTVCQGSPEQRLASGNHRKNQSPGRKASAMSGNSWMPGVDKSELKTPCRPGHGGVGAHNIVSFTSRSYQVTTVNTDKNLCRLSTEGEKTNHSGTCLSTLFLTWLPSGETGYPEPNLLGCYQSLTDAGTTQSQPSLAILSYIWG